jgi:voltage-gated potassium channel
MRQAFAGADVVVNPFDFAGLLLATTHSGHHIADYLGDLDTMQGRVRLAEREVRPEEVGTSLRDLKKHSGAPHHQGRHCLRVLAPSDARASAR